jgi:hypothetical protein
MGIPTTLISSITTTDGQNPIHTHMGISAKMANEATVPEALGAKPVPKPTPKV